MIKNIIFDFDGVLVESIDIKASAFNELFKNAHSDIRRSIVRHQRENAGLSRFEKIRFYYREFLKQEITDEILHRRCQEFSDLVQEKIIAASAVKGALEFIINNQYNFNYFVVSATPEQELREIIARRQWTNYFQAIYGAPTKKTDAIGQLKTAYSLAPLETVFIGDALTDWQAAIAQQINFVARIHSDNKHLFDKVNCYQLPDLSNLDALLKKL